MVSSLIRYYSDDTTVDYSFGVAAGDSKGGVVTKTTHLYSHKDDCWLYGGNFVSFHSRDYSSMSHSKKYRYPYLLSRRGCNDFVFLVMVEVVLIVGKPTSNPGKLN